MVRIRPASSCPRCAHITSQRPMKESVMRLLPRSHLFLAIMLGSINVIGLVWIHHDLTGRPRATTRLLSAVAWPDNVNPDRIRLTFDRSMVPTDFVGHTDEAKLFQLRPAWPGKSLRFLFRDASHNRHHRRQRHHINSHE